MDQQHATVAARREPPPGKMTYEAFLAWLDEDTCAEWVDGAVMMVSPASKRHQDVVGFLYKLLDLYAKSRGLGDVVQAPFQMKTGPELPGREPDLLFVATAHLGRLQETYLDGPADLAVEIVSPESAGRDRGDKFYEYEAGGVAEYWLIDPQRQRAEFYQLGADGRYVAVAPEAEGIYHATVMPGFWLQVDWLWQEPLPPVLDLLRELHVL